ncbi:MAG: hypothetical protein E6J90_48920 [Deltaproteobacteria bacterium]|nr:MAG: hypothetical protein E6J90_48920 [Deltaproteobacteria bacterium]
MKAALGIAIVAAHAAGFVALAGHCRGTELAVGVTGPPASPVLALDAALPEALAGRIAVDDTPPGPGLHRRRWTVRYRGGAERSVGAVQLVGPFQDPDAARCAGRVVVGQRLLDDGRAGPGTIAAAMQRELEAELAGQAVFPAGALVRIEQLALRWAELDHHPDDRELVDAAAGYIRASASLVFDRVTVPVIVALVPAASPRELGFRVAARAALAFDSRALQWLSDKLGGNRLASHLARRQIDDAIATAFAPPPPFPLPGGQTVRFTYCDEPPDIREGSYGALPFGIALGAARDPRILPPRLGHGPRGAPSPATALALDLDLDALNGLLYELWRGGFLDRRLAEAGLDRRFNTDPTVAALLSVRLSPPQLTLPPVVGAAPGGLRLSAEARVAIRDGATTTMGRLWGGLDFRFSPASVDPAGEVPRPAGRAVGVPTPLDLAAQVDRVAVDLGALELSCERGAAAAAMTLVPCYSDLVAALRGRTAELHGALTASFAQMVSDIFVGRITATGVAADLEIRGATPSLAAAASNATLHLELDAAVAPPR